MKNKIYLTQDTEDAIIEYQLDSGVLQNKNEDGAGWFGPKTRAQTKKDYDLYIASGGQSVLTISTQTKTSAKQKQELQSVSRENLMTIEEREAQEMAEFLEIYDIDFKKVSENDTRTYRVVQINGPKRQMKRWVLDK
mgnify:CR=1 FL=1